MDHHVPAAVSAGLRSRGVDVLTAAEDGSAALEDEPLLERAAHQLVVIALGCQGNQFPPDELDAVVLREETELRQALELGHGPAQPRHPVDNLRGWPDSWHARDLVHFALYRELHPSRV